MKQLNSLALGVIAIVIIVGGSSCSKPSADEILSKQLIGKWGYKAEEFSATTVYAENNTFTGTIKTDDGDLSIDVSGIWYIKDKALMSTTTNASHAGIVPIGYTSSNTIISITSTELKSVSDSGATTSIETRIK